MPARAPRSSAPGDDLSAAGRPASGWSGRSCDDGHTTTSELVPGYLDVMRLAVASFLAGYREPTLTAYTQDLKASLGWCQTYDRDVLRVTRGELEM